MARAPARTSLTEVASQLARRWANQRLAAVQSYGRILADYSEGHSSSSAALSAYAKLLAEEAVRYPADAIGIATDYAAAWARTTGVEMGLRAEPSRAAPPIRDLELAAPLGGEALGEFFLDNPHDRPAALSFVTSNFTSSAGETPVSVSVEPAEFVLDAGEERRIRVGVLLDPDIFEPGLRYTANVAVSGFDEMVLRVRLTVLDPI
jgi:hypothetical protein